MDYIKKTTIISCSRKDHLIGVVSQPLKVGDPFRMNSILFNMGQDRIQGEPPKCKVCGTPYFLDGKVHTIKGWMPSDPKMEPTPKPREMKGHKLKLAPHIEPMPKPREMKGHKLKLDPNRSEAKQARELAKVRKDKKDKKDKRIADRRPKD